MKQEVTLHELYRPGFADEFFALYQRWERQEFRHWMGYDMPQTEPTPASLYLEPEAATEDAGQGEIP